MTDKPTGGIAHRLIDQQHYLYAPAWQRAHDGREVVGTCRQPGCQGKLHTVPTHKEGRITWYAAECDNCGGEVAAPDLRTLARSGRRSEMPDGWWDRRETHLKKMAELVANSADGL